MPVATPEEFAEYMRVRTDFLKHSVCDVCRKPATDMVTDCIDGPPFTVDKDGMKWASFIGVDSHHLFCDEHKRDPETKHTGRT